MAVMVAIIMGIGTVNATSLKITYVNEGNAWYEADGAYDGSYGEYSRSWKVNPTESNFRYYLQYYDSVFFAGHGNNNKIGGNEANGFSGDWMFDYELISGQTANEVTLMTCRSYNDFGDELLEKGTKCVVGWPGTLTTTGSKGYDWAYYFYDCARYSTNSGDCENYASIMSKLYGSESKGSCSNTHGTSRGRYGFSESIESKESEETYISGIPVKIKDSRDEQGNVVVTSETYDGEIIAYAKMGKYQKQGTKNLTEKEALSIAREEMKVPKDYVLSETENEDNQYNFAFSRVVEGIVLRSDWICALVNKGTGEISMWSKAYHKELPNLKPTISEVEAVKIANKEFNGGAEILELTVTGCKDNKLCLSWLIEDKDSKFYNYLFLDAHTGESHGFCFFCVG